MHGNIYKLNTTEYTSNKKHFNELMNSYVGMTMVKKEQGQDDYFNQQIILLTLPAYISPLMSSTYVGR